MENVGSALPRDRDLQQILSDLESQLAVLDRIGAHIAAAHIDAAIQQLRLDQARCGAQANGFATEK